MELLVNTRKVRSRLRRASRKASAPGISWPSWTSTPSISHIQEAGTASRLTAPVSHAPVVPGLDPGRVPSGLAYSDRGDIEMTIVTRRDTLLPDPAPRPVRYTVISVDDHLVEPPDMFEGRLPARFVERAPKVTHNEAGNEVWVYEDKVFPQLG